MKMLVDDKESHYSTPKKLNLPNSEKVMQLSVGKLYIVVMTTQRNIYLISLANSFKRPDYFPYKTEYVGNYWVQLIPNQVIGQISAG